ncbi:NAD(P)/FAD-dependent oxidoreductase [Marinicaulis aureus]|uniref:NAD(P)/FAD-dependent oxidoreductase n=1 Tax=Hyphococcus aureus TaxID=2666033 RepID=A0ABW1KUV4_9PROT
MFLFSDQSPVTFHDDLPDEVDVAIIGGGVIGVTTAWFLAKSGRRVLICDKGRIAGEQSSRNWGWVRVNGRDEAETPIAIESLRLWEAFGEELGPDIGFQRRGIIELAETDDEMAFCEGWLDIAKANQLDTKLLSPGDIADVFPAAQGAWKGAMITPSDGRAEPFTAVPAIARAAQGAGVSIRERCAVRTIDVQNGRVTGVVTENGAVKAGAVLCAAGAWSNMFLGNLGVDLPQLAVRGTVARTAPAASVFDGAAGAKDIFIRRREDGGYTIASAITEHLIGASSFRYGASFLPALKSASELRFGLGADPTQALFPRPRWGGEEATPFEKTRVLNPAPSQSVLQKMRTHLNDRIPALRDAAFIESWAGMIDAMPDVVPVMDELRAPKGLFIATGFSGHGFGIGPGAGKVMAEMIDGQAPRYDLKRFRFARFKDGSKIDPGPGI